MRQLVELGGEGEDGAGAFQMVARQLELVHGVNWHNGGNVNAGHKTSVVVITGVEGAKVTSRISPHINDFRIQQKSFSDRKRRSSQSG